MGDVAEEYNLWFAFQNGLTVHFIRSVKYQESCFQTNSHVSAFFIKMMIFVILGVFILPSVPVTVKTTLLTWTAQYAELKLLKLDVQESKSDC